MVWEAAPGRTTPPNRKGYQWPRRFKPTSSCRCQLERLTRPRQSAPRSVTSWYWCRPMNSATASALNSNPRRTPVFWSHRDHLAETVDLKKTVGLEIGALDLPFVEPGEGNATARDADKKRENSRFSRESACLHGVYFAFGGSIPG